ncbi:MAG: NAD-dependent succinate-semialdehyde dehydrogenase [Pseudomonas sp.]|nr:NAD-dependent succinate-semialdehyde dehydrogenase [Pseudomonas sp.]
MTDYRNFIDGRFVSPEGPSAIDIINPATGEIFAGVPTASDADVIRAVEAAARAQKSWGRLPAIDRGDALRRVADAVERRAGQIGEALARESGKSIADATAETIYAAVLMRYHAEWARRIEGEVIESDTPDETLMLKRTPIGVVACLIPFNFPIYTLVRKIAPALVAGNAVVVRPSNNTPTSAFILAEAIEEAALPPGLINIMTMTHDVAKTMCTRPEVGMITLTGSVAAGRTVLEYCKANIAKPSLELGGKTPVIVEPDADLDAAVEGALVAKYRNAGQTCVCANRLYVHEAVYDAFAEKLAAAVAKLRVGPGDEAGVVIGPLIDGNAVAKVQAHLADALEKGAKVLQGGKAHELGGHFFEPTVITDVTPDMRVAREETFGPLAPLFRFSDEAEVVRQANDTEFGLAGYFYTRDLGRTFRVAEALEYGMVGINTGLISNEVAPFGGIKASGLGREGSKYGLDEYLEIKYLCLGGI